MVNDSFWPHAVCKSPHRCAKHNTETIKRISERLTGSKLFFPAGKKRIVGNPSGCTNNQQPQSSTNGYVSPCYL